MVTVDNVFELGNDSKLVGLSGEQKLSQHTLANDINGFDIPNIMDNNI